jgi:predicted ATPase
MERMLRSIFYVGPLREYPKRLYLWSGETPDHVGVKGDRAVEAILAAGERAFNWKPKQKTKHLDRLVAEQLHLMGLIRDFKVKPLEQHRKEYEVLVRTSPKLPEVKLTDVGFGVSQVLPVIVECFYVPRRSIVIFEQPEIHLHPRVQADLADLFIAAIRAREDGTERDCQFIIESHSEHFLRRLQRRIAEEELSAEDAALYFVSTQEESARIEELEIDKFGNIRNWPEGFFGDEMGDLVARSEAQAKRMKGMKGMKGSKM